MLVVALQGAKYSGRLSKPVGANTKSIQVKHRYSHGLSVRKSQCDIVASKEPISYRHPYLDRE